MSFGLPEDLDKQNVQVALEANQVHYEAQPVAAVTTVTSAPVIMPAISGAPNSQAISGAPLVTAPPPVRSECFPPFRNSTDNYIIGAHM